mmetsp:Transcript_13543/g.11611  ORF Transcript_13543/g.11611 Transcript_13543/m.11611 type:complete len:86 (+) Transcript_13543:452-709(+)
MITIAYSAKVVLLAAFVTAAVVIGLTIYAIRTKSDFTIMGGMLYIILSALIMIAFLNFFIRSSILQMGLSFAFACLFGIYLVYDT